MSRCAIVLLLLVASCTASSSTVDPQPASSALDPGASGAAPGSPGRAVSGAFGGVYEVPVPPSLASAASYDMTEMNWTVVNGTARLHYKLPRALVGTSIAVDFSGPYDGKADRVTLTGEAGTADCTLTPTEIACYEEMRGLLPIDADMAVVEKLASGQPGSPHDRITVSQRFVVDPIGIAKLDLRRPGVPEAETEPEGDDHGSRKNR